MATTATVVASATVYAAVALSTGADPLSPPGMESMHGTQVQPQARPADLSQGAGRGSAAPVVWPSGQGDAVLPANGRARVGHLPVSVAPVKGGAGGGRVSVSALSHSEQAGTWRNGVVLQVQAPPGGADVAVDYSGFAGAYGGDWGSRLRLVELPACAITTPDAAGCGEKTLPASVNNRAGKTVSAQAAGGMSLLAVTAGAAGTAGDFGASTLQPSSTWSAGGNAGDFAWNYPMRTPPSLGGPAPSISLAYSSSSVDGRNESTNNQPSWLGEGFEYAPGYIERTYKACADDKTGGNNANDSGDRCWGTDNATLSLNGTGGELIKDDATGAWRIKHDDNSKVERLTDTVNADNDHEYWKVTTADGNQFFFGLNRLPGYTGTAPADKTTNSVNTVPVAGNQAGEPCHQSGFVASFCNQAWRWNLDYVVDRYGNTMSVFYNTESNNYGRYNSNTDVVSYTRGGTVDHIDYGTDRRSGTDTENTATNPPMRVVFGTADRCLADCATHDQAHWPDTPWDQSCTSSSSCTTVHSPSFWTTKRLTSITTKVWDAGTSGYRDVDVWTLTHNFPDPGDGTRAGLWLESIAHTGKVGGSASLPEINFDWKQLPNRVDTATDGKPAMNWMRVDTIWTDTGSKISVRYTDPDCVVGTRMPASPQNNTLRCYPVLEQQPDKSIKTEYFHKYLVSNVTVADLTGGGTDQVTSYEYVGTPAWRHTDDDGMTKDNLRTWSDFRGYRQVNTRAGEPGSGKETLSESTFFQGMYGDQNGAGGTRTNALPAIDVNGDGNTTGTADAPAVNDENAFSGTLRQTTVYEGDESKPISTQVLAPWQSAATASRNMGQTTSYARHIGTATTWAGTKLAAGGWRVTRNDDTFDAYGMPTQSADSGDVAVSGDERCTITTYGRNTAANLLSLASQTEAYALPCGQHPSSEADVISIARSRFDNQAWGAAPTKGQTTLEERAESYASGAVTGWLTTATHAYDAYGRENDVTDVRGNHLYKAYTPAAGGPLTKVTLSDSQGWSSFTELEPAWGSTVAQVDLNGRRTDLEYEPLGRLAKVWQPNHAKASFPTQPSTTYTYLVRNTGGVNAVTTQKLNANGNYVTSYDLFDGLTRPRQTQQGSSANGNVGTLFTETKYDAAGRTTLTDTHFDATVQPSTTLYTIAEWLPKTVLTTEYDRAGRPTATVFSSSGAEKLRSTTVYGGDRTTTVPPDGGTATTSITDGLGHTVEVRQYRNKADAGSNTRSTFDAQYFGFDRKGQQTSTTDNAGNVWTYKFDFLGRQTGSTDPDKGTSSVAYDDNGDLLSTTDSLQQTLAYTYDSIGRKTGLYLGSTTGTKLATWAYDPAGAKGQVASASRWVGTDEYKVKVRGYTPMYQSTGEDYTIPASQTGLAGTYSFTRSYKVDGSIATLGFPNVGGLGAETLTYTYDDVTGLPEQLQTNSPGIGQYVSNTDYTAMGEVSFVQLQTTSGSWLQRAFTYDDATRRLVRAMTVRQTSPQAVADVNYTFDNVGDIVKLADAPSGQTADTQCFTYDHVQRLTAAWTPASGDCAAAPSAAALGGPAPYWQSWTFDAVGDRKTQTTYATGGNTTATYNYPAPGSARPHAVGSVVTTGPGVNRTDTYTYDTTGNTTGRPGLAAAQVLTWDAEGKLAKNTEAGKDTTYIYAADGAQLVRKDPVNTTVFLPGTELQRNNTTGVVSATRTFQWAGQDVVTVSTGAPLTWLVTDNQGTQQISVAAGNQAVTRRRQTPYGAPRGAAVAWPTGHGFVGGDNEPTGLTHIGARQYDSALGRFISVDPVFGQNAPQSWNGYSYADNNPITQSDPTGLESGKDGSCLICKVPGFAPAWKASVYLGGKAIGNGMAMVDKGAKAVDSSLAYMSSNYGGAWSAAYSAETQVKTSVMGTPSDPSPVRVGWEWATGTGPKERFFDDNNTMTHELQLHSTVQDARAGIAEQILKGNPEYTRTGPLHWDDGRGPKVWSHTLSSKALVKDIMTNETAFFLGSYDVTGEIKEIDLAAGTATVVFTATNESDMNSGTHTAPFLGGYTHEWDEQVGNWVNDQFKTGPGGPKSQTFTWTETIDLHNPKPPTTAARPGWNGWGGNSPSMHSASWNSGAASGGGGGIIFHVPAGGRFANYTL
ncbi:RHS repeat-associated core domain-containing protein [Dactylosporangium salmoneum]|uniref:RHS repeat-associated core domain-containing protein n=1 Tax=Dactylosporangium salmoneum TaxID=53361 RepID=A0ABN3FFJ8_9ACTN